MAKLEDELEKIARYTKLVWQWEETYNAQVKIADKSDAMLIIFFKEMKKKPVELREASLSRYTTI